MKHLLYTLVLLLLFSGCVKEHESTPTRTIIAYLAADNDLWEDALRSIEEMKTGYRETGTKLIVFADIYGESPRLLEIGSNTSTTVKVYPECNSADAAQMREVLEEVTALYPADGYGLILWSHGTSWLPAGAKLRSFGHDNGKQMNVEELAAALPVKFDYILFDACLMGSVEVAYELREKAGFMIASSMPTLYTGFPYEDVLPELLSPSPDLKKVAKGYFDYYEQVMTGMYQSATIAVIDMRELDKLAAATRNLLESRHFNVQSLDRAAIQRLDAYGEQYLFDFLDFIDKAFPETGKTGFIRQLNKTVLYKAHTAQFMSRYDIRTFCGLSCYIPFAGRNDLNDYYKKTDWGKAIGFEKYLQ